MVKAEAQGERLRRVSGVRIEVWHQDRLPDRSLESSASIGSWAGTAGR